MGGRHGAALFCVANCDFGFAANGELRCASTSLQKFAMNSGFGDRGMVWHSNQHIIDNSLVVVVRNNKRSLSRC